MSVPVFKRTPNKLQAYKDTLDLVTYTIKLCNDNKTFPRPAKWNIVNTLYDKSLECLIEIRRANKIKGDNAKSAEERLSLQYNVILNFDALWVLMDLAKETFNIDSDKMDKWTSLMLNAENCVSAWRKSDKEKFKKEFNL